MNSKLYKGYVEHNRSIPNAHEFKYAVYFYALDLDELTELDERIPLFGYNRIRPSAIHDKDYLDKGRDSIKDKLKKRLIGQGVNKDIDKIILVTSARYLNYVFNPVNFYYCVSSGKNLVCMAVEVNNTFGERHLYILTQKETPSHGLPFHFFTEKMFHVSPFNNLEGTYEFFFSEVAESIDIRIHLIREQTTIFKARLSGQALPLTPANHLKTFLRQPLIPHLTLPRIYWEAFRLFFQKKMTYHDKPVALNPMTIMKQPSLLQTICIRVIVNALKRIETGFLTLRLPDGQEYFFGDSASDNRGEIVINDYHFFTNVAFHGKIGVGESYVDSEWDSPSVTDVFKVFSENIAALSGGDLSTSIFTRLKESRKQLRQKNSLVGSKDNIHTHYDIGNDFYRLFLDDGMNYSCAYFPSPKISLEDAQKAKLSKVIEKARIGKDDHVLEIGCGWGAFAVEAAQQTGCQVTGITVSEAQFSYAKEKVHHLGLDGQVEILLEDYRNITNTFDKIVSIEMLEAVGQEYLSVFFQCCDRLLKPNGLMVLQSITIPDDHYDKYRKGTDWIRKHMFPGGHLPSLTAICQAMSNNTGFIIEHLENISIHYALTLKEWRKRFTNHTQKLYNMGFDRAFQRKWHYYFSICEAGFSKRVLGDVQMVFTRPNNNGLPTF